ncbi:MAG: TIGR02147 family protein [Chitinispirillaceae bacterium]|nr:TIGR02147 family protein [Chitinispirillaceae bacterium]
MKRIEEYDDYRLFLRDFIEDRKKRFPFFSNRYFSRRAGIASPSLCQEVIDGKRNLTEKTIAAFCKGMALTDRDAAFFRVLVHCNQSKTIDEQAIYLAELKRFRKTIAAEQIPADSFAYFEHWYHPALRELACLLDWKGDYELLARTLNPPISAAAAKKSIALLLRLGFLRKNPDGSHTQSSPAIKTGDNVVGVRSLNRQFGELGIAAIEGTPINERYISSMTAGISRKTYEALEGEIESFKDRLRGIVDEDKGADAVYTVNLHLFPVSKREPPRK